MLIERNEFRIKFGHVKEALALWKEIFDSFQDMKDKPRIRILTDVTGPAYTIVLELQLRGFQDLGFKAYQWQTNPKAHELYKKVIPLCESAHKTLYTLEYEN